jgi:DNA-binding NarL/FixJ family response regulator
MWLATAVGRSREATRLAGAAEAVRASIPAPLPFYQKAEHADATKALRHRLKADSFAAAWAEGQMLSLHHAIRAASDVLTAIAAQSSGDSAGPLTAREWEVAGRIARGLSNREIAADLVISVKTAANHVDHILNKLGLHSRGQVAEWVRQRELRPPEK